MSPPTHTASAPTAAQHQHAMNKSKLYIATLATLPQARVNAAMFTATAPSQLSADESIAYTKHYNRLVEALNRPPGTSLHFSKDQASWARRGLWVLWFRARDIAADEDGDEDDADDEGNEEEAGGDVDEDTEMAETDDIEITKTGDTKTTQTDGKKTTKTADIETTKTAFAVPAPFHQWAVMGGRFIWSEDDYGRCRLSRNGSVVYSWTEC